MSWDWALFDAGFAAGFGYWLGAAVGVAAVLLAGWWLALASLMLVNGLQDRLERRRAAQQACGGKPLEWTAEVRTNPSYITIHLRQAIRSTTGRVMHYEESELTRVPVGAAAVAATRARVAEAFAEAQEIAKLLNDPAGPDDPEAIVRSWSPPAGAPPVDVA